MVSNKKSIFIILTISLLISISNEDEYEANFLGATKVNYNSIYVVDEDLLIKKGDFLSTESKETVFLVVGGATLTLEEGVTITKEDPISGIKRQLMEDDDNSNNEYDYGINSAIVVIGSRSKAIIKGVTIKTNGYGAHGVVAIDSGEVEITDSHITTSSDNSVGLLTLLNGEISADNVDITSNGVTSPTISGDGTVTAISLTLESNGEDSPLMYSLGSISISSSTGEAHNSQIAIIEGPHNLVFNHCEFSCSGKGKKIKIKDENFEDEQKEDGNAAVMIYKPNDQNKGMANFDCLNTKLIIQDSDNIFSAPLFLVSNNIVSMTLVEIETSFHSGIFMKSIGNSDVSATTQQMEIIGNIVAKGLSIINLKYDCNCDNKNFGTEGSVNSSCA